MGLFIKETKKREAKASKKCSLFHSFYEIRFFFAFPLLHPSLHPSARCVAFLSDGQTQELRTPLHETAEQGFVYASRYLLSKGADVNAQDDVSLFNPPCIDFCYRRLVH